MATWFYARVSTKKQSSGSQVEAARQRGIPTKNIVIEVASGAKHDRPKLNELLTKLERGDTLVTYKLDRLARSLQHLMAVVKDLKERGIAFETLDGISTKDGATGNLVLPIFGAVAEFERALILERTLAGLAVARAEGKVSGRKRSMTPEQRRRWQLARASRMCTSSASCCMCWSEGEAWMRWRTFVSGHDATVALGEHHGRPKRGGLDRQGGSDLSIA